LFVFTTPAWSRPTPPIPLQPFFENCENAEPPCLYGVTLSPIDGYIEVLEPVLFAHGYTQIEEGGTGASETMDSAETVYRIYAPAEGSELCSAQVYYSSGDGHIIWIDMMDCGEFYVEDLITHFGIPTFLTRSRAGGGSLAYSHAGIQFFFSSELLPDALVTRMVVSPPWEGGPYLDWHGYAAFWIYCLYERYYEDCWME
jgi:hypothetical protein